MTKEDILRFVSEQKTMFIASIDETGYPVVRAMLAARKIDGNSIYFSTNTSSRKVAQFLASPKASVYCYKRGKFKYQGVNIVGEMTVCTDQPTKDAIWRLGDGIFYKQGKTDPDYCVLKFDCREAEYYCDFKLEHVSFE